MNGGAIRATLIFLFNNTSKMPNPTLVMRKTQVLRLSREIWRVFFAAELLRGRNHRDDKDILHRL